MRIVANDVSRTSAVMHSDGLGLLPIHFYITFDGFLTVGKCRLAWRYRDDVVSSLKDGLISLSVKCSTTAKVRSMTDEQLAAMHRLLAEYHRKLAQQATLNVVQQYHADLAQRLADEAVLIPRRTAIAERLHEREQKIAKDGGENE